MPARRLVVAVLALGFGCRVDEDAGRAGTGRGAASEAMRAVPGLNQPQEHET